jgi:hypothetical protein
MIFGRAAPTDDSPPFAVVLGTNEIASAIGVFLLRRGYVVVLSHDPASPVLRRKMAFHDALFDDAVSIGNITARRADSGLQVLIAFGEPRTVLVTQMGLLDLIILRNIDVLVDARMQKYQVTPDLRRLARLTIGVGPGFCAGVTCEVAIETLPERAGQVIRSGATTPPDGIVRPLGNLGGDRFVLAPVAGRWRTAIEIGTRVYKDLVLGMVDDAIMGAPFDGIVRGAVRDGTEVPAGVKLVEIDPRGRRAVWTGIDERARRIAQGVVAALHESPAPAHTVLPKPYLVK